MTGLPESGPLDRLVEDGRAIGLRVVLDLTVPSPSHIDDPAPIVDVPDTAASLLEDFSAYGS